MCLLNLTPPMTMTFNDDDERSLLVNQLSDGAREGIEEGAGRDE